jgi:hypothetical protein
MFGAVHAAAIGPRATALGLAALSVQLAPPLATVELARSSNVHVATAGDRTVVVVSERYFPDLQALLAERFGTDRLLSAKEAGPAGYEVVDFSACKTVRQPAVAGVDGDTFAQRARPPRPVGLRRPLPQPPPTM